MKNLQIEISYTWENEKGQEIKTKASIGGDWNQWAGTQDELSEIMELTSRLNEVANEFILTNCEEEEEI